MSTLTHQNVIAGNVIDPSVWNTTMAEILAIVDAMQGDQIQGGIDATQLIHRFAINPNTICVFPPSAVADMNTGGSPDPRTFIVPTGVTSLCKVEPPLIAGHETFLAAINMWVMDTIQDTAWPFVEIYRNTTLIGNAGVILDVANNFYRLQAGDPIASPLSSWNAGDYLDIRVGRSGGAGNPRCRGLYVTPEWKFRLAG